MCFALKWVKFYIRNNPKTALVKKSKGTAFADNSAATNAIICHDKHPDILTFNTCCFIATYLPATLPTSTINDTKL